MRQNKLLNALMPGIRHRLLAAVLLDPEREWYRSDLAKHLRTSPSSLQRELTSLHSVGVLAARTEANRTYYRADTSCPVFTELRQILIKTSAVVQPLSEALSPLTQKIQNAFVFGSIARGEERNLSDIDVFVIGEATLIELSVAVGSVEQSLGRPVNLTSYSRSEFDERVAMGNHFVQDVLRNPRIDIIGVSDELAKAAG